MNTTHGDGNQHERDLRGDPGADRTSGDDTRDHVSASSQSFSLAARALVEPLQHLKVLIAKLVGDLIDQQAIPDDSYKLRYADIADEINRLSALLGKVADGE